MPTAAVLQGLITNDTNHLHHEDAAPLYSAMLNSKGRQMYDMMMHPDRSASNAILVDCPAETADSLKTLLHRYKLRSQVSIDDVSGDFSIACAWQSNGASRHEAGEDNSHACPYRALAQACYHEHHGLSRLVSGIFLWFLCVINLSSCSNSWGFGWAAAGPTFACSGTARPCPETR